jgi:hypothetical protein
MAPEIKRLKSGETIGENLKFAPKFPEFLAEHTLCDPQVLGIVLAVL